MLTLTQTRVLPQHGDTDTAP